jgi:hypothetical protein
MPRCSILSANERDGLLAIPEAHDELIRLYTLSQTDLAVIRQPASRAGEPARIRDSTLLHAPPWHRFDS